MTPVFRLFARLAAILPLALVSQAPLFAESVTAPCIADTWVASEANRDAGAFHGTGATLAVAGLQSFGLLQFDLAAARGLTVDKAVLRIHRQADPVPLDTVGLSTISGSGAWTEAGFAFAGAGQRPWAYPASDLTDVTFSLGGSLYTYTRARSAGEGWYEIDVPPAIAHALITGDQFGLMLTDEKGQTRARHLFGSRESATPPVLVVEGRREDRSAPGPVRSLRQGAEPLDTAPAQARSLGRTALRPGSVILHFGGAGDDAGRGVATRYEVRYARAPLTAANFAAAAEVPRWMMDPLAPKPHPMATANALRDEVFAVVEELEPGAVYHFAARAIDEAANPGPVSPLGRYRAYARAVPALPGGASGRRGQGARGAAAPAAVADPPVWAVPDLLKIHPGTGALLEEGGYSPHRRRNAVWDAESATVRLAGARNEFVAFQLAIESRRPLQGIEVTVAEPLFPGSRLPEVFRKAGAIRLFREWFVPETSPPDAATDWYPDPLVPLEAPFDLPAKDNAVPGQTVQPVFVDVYIPRDAAPGVHKGRLLVRAPAGLKREIAIELRVLPVELPDKLNFIVDLNCYGGVDSGSDIKRASSAEYRSLVHAYHRLAHLERANLDILGYGQTGNVEPDHAPPLSGVGASTRVASWKDWDAYFGPLLDGSAFAGLPRGPVPVPAMYLPFFEHWPGDIHRGYKFDYPASKTEQEYNQTITRHALEASPIEEAFTQEYQDRFSAVAREFARHIKERGWDKATRYLVYLNDKHYRKDPGRRTTPGQADGTSWWLLDEPNVRDDYRAISYFGHLAKRWLEPDAPIKFRTDISRTEWMRDILSGQVDLNCISTRFFERSRYLVDNRSRLGREYWNYGHSNHPRDTNVTMRAWCWRVWLGGGDGLLPWNATRGAGAWDRAEQLTVFYPGGKFGKAEPYSSLRLKAYRRGQQDIEYLVMLAARQGWSRETVTDAVSGLLDLGGEVSSSSPEDPGRVRYRNVTNDQLDQVRLRVAGAMEKP